MINTQSNENLTENQTSKKWSWRDFWIEFVGAGIGELIGYVFLAIPLVFAWFFISIGMAWLILPLIVVVYLIIKKLFFKSYDK